MNNILLNFRSQTWHFKAQCVAFPEFNKVEQMENKKASCVPVYFQSSAIS